MNCRNCNQSISANYCGYCGTPVVLKRVDAHYIVHEIQHVLHFEKGILYTIQSMLLRPGKNIRTFIADDRSRLIKPVIYIIITSLIYSVISHFFHLDRYQEGSHSQPHSATSNVMAWIENHYGYANIIMGVFIGLWLKLIYRKSAYNFFEILIMLCFVMGTGMLLLGIFALVEGTTGLQLANIGAAVTLIYCSWAIGQFLGGRQIASYLFAAIAYLLGMVSFFMIVFLLGFLIDSLTTLK